MARPRKHPLPEEIEQAVTPEVQTEPTIKKKGTPPGWRPAGQIPRLKAPSGYTAKWANPEKLDKLRAEGWEIMKPEDNRGQQILKVDVNDTGSLTGALRYREMIAIMLPNALKQARDEWVRNENREAVKHILKNTDEKFEEFGVQTFKPEGQSGRIVIE
jgi:hypothetical protein